MPISDLIDLATNQTLARTIMTSLTLVLALLALFLFGGPVIRSFTAAMIWGIFVAHRLVDLHRRPDPHLLQASGPAAAAQR